MYVLQVLPYGLVYSCSTRHAANGSSAVEASGVCAELRCRLARMLLDIHADRARDHEEEGPSMARDHTEEAAALYHSALREHPSCAAAMSGIARVAINDAMAALAAGYVSTASTRLCEAAPLLLRAMGDGLALDWRAEAGVDLTVLDAACVPSPSAPAVGVLSNAAGADDEAACEALWLMLELLNAALELPAAMHASIYETLTGGGEVKSLAALRRLATCALVRAEPANRDAWRALARDGGGGSESEVRPILRALLRSAELDSDAQHATNWYLLGRDAAARDEVGLAHHALICACQLAPKSATPLIGYAQLCLERGEGNLAEAAFTRALQIDGNGDGIRLAGLAHLVWLGIARSAAL